MFAVKNSELFDQKIASIKLARDMAFQPLVKTKTSQIKRLSAVGYVADENLLEKELFCCDRATD